MLRVTVPETEYFDERTQKFHISKAYTFTIEHSLVSLSKWESKWKKPFLARNEKTTEELIDYIRCMTITQNVPEDVYRNLGSHPDTLSEITEYMKDSMTATTFSSFGNEGKVRSGNQVVTAEVIYYWMIQLNIPIEFQKWHLNRLLALIKVCDLKTAPKQKMSNRQIYNRNSQLNAMRRKMLNSKG